MISTTIFIQLLIRVFLIMLNCFAIAFLYFTGDHFFILAHLILLTLVQSWLLARYLNKTNRNIDHLLENYINDDTVSIASGKKKDKVSEKIYSQLEQLSQKTRQAEKELSRHLAFIQGVTRNIPGGLFTVNNEGKIDICSKGVAKLTGKKSLFSINDFKEKPEIIQLIQQIKPGERKVLKADTCGELKVLAFSCTEIRDRQHNTRIITFEDIQPELTALEVETWQKFMRVLTHEIMNSFSPLISANESLSTIFNSIDFSEGKVINQNDIMKIRKLEKGISIIRNRSKGIHHFIEKYRQLRKLPKPVCSEISVAKLFEEVILLYQEQFNQKNITCLTEVKPGNLTIFADKEQIMQVLINLIKNSIEATDETYESKIFLNACMNDNQRIIVSIKDNGMGIEQDQKNEIFTPFFSTKKEGSGIGLSLARQIMHQHKGEIHLNQEVSNTEMVLTF